MSAAGFVMLSDEDARYFESVVRDHANAWRFRGLLLCRMCKRRDCAPGREALVMLATAGRDAA
jgi:hypothetical protein